MSECPDNWFVPPPPPIRCGPYELRFDGRALVMGIINVTPDSFSGDGLGADVEGAVAQGLRFAAEGADILDVGGESTRPGSQGVSVEEELGRVIPVVEGLAAAVDLPISIDTSKAEVARPALAVGATLINDVRALREPGMLQLAVESGAAVCLMHVHGQPRDMQHDPYYDDVLREVFDFLAERCGLCVAAGVVETQIMVDPGFGFGKTAAHNLELVRRLPELRALGRPVLVGASRKRTLGEVTGRPVAERAPAGLALHALAADRGAHIIRTHDVAATVDMARVVAALHERDYETTPVRRTGGAGS